MGRDIWEKWVGAGKTNDLLAGDKVALDHRVEAPLGLLDEEAHAVGALGALLEDGEQRRHQEERRVLDEEIERRVGEDGDPRHGLDAWQGREGWGVGGGG